MAKTDANSLPYLPQVKSATNRNQNEANRKSRNSKMYASVSLKKDLNKLETIDEKYAGQQLDSSNI